MKTKFLSAAFAAALLLTACGKATPEQPVVPEESAYTGTVTVIYEGAPFDNENISVDFTPAEDGASASITIHQIRFVPQMPVTIDVTIPGITLLGTAEKILLSCARVVPLAMGGEYPRYTVTDLSGEIAGDELVFSLKFGDYPTSFAGRRQGL
ncbi:MAG: hypothetical protein IJV37_05255 [Bacteroidales bacterium]|nr:hypothetical protein [Bacteroidales bacterium]